MRMGMRSLVVVGALISFQMVLTGCSQPHKTAGMPAGGAAAVGVSPAECSCGLTPACMPTHPFMLFGRAEVPAVAARKTRDPLMQECWGRLADLANKPDVLDDQEEDSPDRYDRQQWWDQLEARAFVGRITNDKAMIQRAISLMQRALEEIDPVEFYGKGGENFHIHAAPLRALALAWDWLYQDMTPQQRGQILPGLENWCSVCFTFTDKQWWREASVQRRGDPDRRAGHPLAGHPPGLDPPQGRHVAARGDPPHRAELLPHHLQALGHLLGRSQLLDRGAEVPGAVLRGAAPGRRRGPAGALRGHPHHAVPDAPMDATGRLRPIGDNTDYGRRTFAAEYLLGLARTRDAVGLWTWRNYGNTKGVDPLITYLWYPLDLKPVSPAATKVPAAKYFEMTENRAGYFFSRTKWQDPDAAFFAFVTRYERCNHQHYDMNSFLLGGFGTLFATHEMLYPYDHPRHGVDHEHNMIIVDEGGWPRHANGGSCGDKNSTEGVLLGLATGPFADYVRGDAKWSYRDNTIIIDNPAIRAERAFLFVKAGATPYMVALDDLQFSDDAHDYRWQWYAPSDLTITGTGTTGDPIVLAAKKGSCALCFVGPRAPAVTVGKIQNVSRSSRSRPTSQPAATQASAAGSRPAATASQPARAAPVAPPEQQPPAQPVPGPAGMPTARGQTGSCSGSMSRRTASASVTPRSPRFSSTPPTGPSCRPNP